jgi:hypothetical protein
MSVRGMGIAVELSLTAAPYASGQSVPAGGAARRPINNHAEKAKLLFN